MDRRSLFKQPQHGSNNIIFVIVDPSVSICRFVSFTGLSFGVCDGSFVDTSATRISDIPRCVGRVPMCWSVPLCIRIHRLHSTSARTPEVLHRVGWWPHDRSVIPSWSLMERCRTAQLLRLDEIQRGWWMMSSMRHIARSIGFNADRLKHNTLSSGLITVRSRVTRWC